MPPRPTLLDVAAHTGVSKSLVSLALRGDPGVSARTRERIQLAADHLGYRSNALARSLKQGRTMLIGAVISSLDNPYHTEIVAGVEEAAEAAGFSVLLVHGSRDRGHLARHLDTLLGLNVDGLVVVSSWLEEEQLRAAARRAPVVMVGRPLGPVGGVDTVTNDDIRGATLAVDHLVGLGRTRIAHVSGSSRPAGRARRDGYEAAMARNGLDADVRVVAPDTSLDELVTDGYQAIFARNDVEAFDVLEHAHSLGLTVPGDLAVVGYDDSSLALRARPHLTSVHQPRGRMGALAVELLLDRLGGRAGDRHEVLEPRLVVRGSTVAG